MDVKIYLNTGIYFNIEVSDYNPSSIEADFANRDTKVVRIGDQFIDKYSVMSILTNDIEVKKIESV